MSLLRETRRLLRLHGISPRRRLGQNFVVSSALLERLVAHASLRSGDVVLEVGAGLGFLTRLLAERCRRVIAVEVDHRLAGALRGQVRGLPNVDLVEGDILTAPVPGFDKLVSTPPYSISSPLLFWLLERRFDCAVLTFQSEFAARLAAPVGGGDYGRLTVAAYYLAEVELLDRVSREAFYPPPEVDSTIVRLRPREPPFPVEDREAFFELVRVLFSQRNRKVRKAVLPLLRSRGMARGDAAGLADSLPFRDRRVRELAPEDFGALSGEVSKRLAYAASRCPGSSSCPCSSLR